MVVDTSALLAVIFEEPECARFAELFATSETTLCSAVSALEGGIVIEARKGKAASRDFRAFLRAARIKIVDFTPEQAGLAMEAWRRALALEPDHFVALRNLVNRLECGCSYHSGSGRVWLL